MSSTALRKLLIVTIIAAVGVWIWWANEGPTQNTQASIGDQAPSLTLAYNTEEQPAEKSLISQAIQAQLRGAGIDVTLEPLPSSLFYDRVGERDFSSILTLWYIDYPDSEGFLTDFYSGASFRLSRYSNPRFDAAYEAGLAAPTGAEKRRHFLDAEGIVMADMPWVPLYSDNELFLLTPQAVGFKSNAYQYYDYRYVDVPNLRVATDVEAHALDPALTYDLGSKQIITQSYEGLLALDENNRITASLAENWTVAASGDAITFKLRDGARFQSGCRSDGNNSPVRAADVKASFERLIKSDSPYNYIFNHVRGVGSFKSGASASVAGFVIDNPLEFRIELEKPFPTMLSWLLVPAAYIVPHDLPVDFDFNKQSCGTGPFKLESWDGKTARLARNPDYWANDGGAPLPKADRLTIRAIREPAVQLAAMENGELDITNVPLSLYDQILDAEGQLQARYRDKAMLRETPLNNLKFITFNMESAPWGASHELRQMLSKHIDREKLVNALFKGKARAAYSVIPPGLSLADEGQ